MKVRLIVPRRADGAHRDRLWAYCRAYWEEQRPGWEIAEGDHTDGVFNRSAAINAAAEGEWDVGVILDADTVVDADQVELGIWKTAETGRLVLPYTDRHLLSRAGTEKILGGYGGSWDPLIASKQTTGDAYVYISGAQIVPRALWDETGGFDPRFEGWGGEDDAFHAVCHALAGQDPREDRLPGACWHLWHRRSAEADTSTATWKAAKELSDRYIAAGEDWNQMRALLAEDRGPDQVVIVVLTTGHRETLAATIASIEDSVRGPVGRKLICVDDRTTEVAFDGWDVVTMGPPRGYPVATRHAREHAVGSGQPWIFWTEDDFTFNRPVDIAEMQRVMDANRELIQLSLMRQAWYPDERRAGGVIEAKPEAFTQRDGFIEHRAYWTTNPMLTRRMFVADHDWPKGTHSELRFARMIFADPQARGGILGQIGDPPWVTHHGEERAGFGY